MYGLDIVVLIFYMATLYVDKRHELLKSTANTLFLVCFIYIAHFALSFSNWGSLEFWFSVLDSGIYYVEEGYYWVSPLVTLLTLARNSLWCFSRAYKQVVRPKSEEVTVKQEHQEELYRLQCNLNNTRLTLENERRAFNLESNRTSQNLKHCKAVIYELRGQVRDLRKSKTVSLDEDILRDIIVLCHPDKHNSSQFSMKVTSLLNAMRG